MENVNISVELLASVLGTDAGVLAESLKNADGNLDGFVKENFTKRIGSIRKEGLDEGYGRGKREGLSSKEKELAAKYEIGDFSGGMDNLLDAILEKNTQKSKLNPDTVRTSEIYINDLKQKSDEALKYKTELKQYKEAVESEKIKGIVNKAALSIIENQENKYVLPSNDVIKGNLVNTFLESIWKDGVKYDIKDGKILGVMDKEGTLLRDEMQQPMTYESYVRKIAEGYFEVSQSDNRQTPGAKTNAPAYTGSLNFTDREQFFAAYKSETDPARKEALKAYEAKRSAQGSW